MDLLLIFCEKLSFIFFSHDLLGALATIGADVVI